MHLLRLEVEGGFLDGVDLEFASGLNVLIGARGSGKTSVLELLRFGLGIPAITDEAQARATKQARSVLGGGHVIVTLRIDGQEVRVERNAIDDQPRFDGVATSSQSLFVSQNELEAIGLDSTSRRRILDQVVGDQEPQMAVDAALSRAEAVVAQSETIRASREKILDQIETLRSVSDELVDAERIEEETSIADAKLAEIQADIAARSAEAGRLDRRAESERATAVELRSWVARAQDATSDTPDLSGLEPSHREAVEAHLARFRTETSLVAVALITEAEGATVRARDAADSSIVLQREVRERTEELEALQTGAGQRARQIAQLRRKAELRNQLTEQLENVERQLLELDQLRTVALDDVDTARASRYDARAAAASRLGQTFHNEIEVRVTKLGAIADYAAALGEALQGSGMQYKALARQLASAVGPRELVETVEHSDLSHLIQITGLTQERAERLISHLRHQSVRDVLLCPLDDSVDFALLDGQGYKPTGELSMGQRCTVVLPLLLSEGRDLTVLDQPEDHLDNAFVVDTLVQSLRDRKPGAQLLIATHNANIPVLGEADRVVVLGSNGRKGFKRFAADLTDSDVVASITQLMEGGAQAFAQRAAFYSSSSD